LYGPPFVQFIINWFITDSLFLWHIQRRGAILQAWTLNEEEDFIDAFAKGFHGIITDFPSRLRKFVDKHVDSEGQQKV